MNPPAIDTRARQLSRGDLHKPARAGAAAGLVLLLLGLAQGATGCALAQVSGPPEPSASTMTSQTPPAAWSRIVHDPDGHAVITRDAHGTDITVQRTPGPIPPVDDYGYGFEGAGPGFRDRDETARFRWPPMHERHPTSPSLRDEYRQRMLDRLDGHR